MLFRSPGTGFNAKYSLLKLALSRRKLPAGSLRNLFNMPPRKQAGGDESSPTNMGRVMGYGVALQASCLEGSDSPMVHHFLKCSFSKSKNYTVNVKIRTLIYHAVVV